jgi:radical SAM protein with 4Fe4S-binding SPASM domain
MNTSFLDKALNKEFNFYATAKWLYYPARVKKIKEHNYYAITPVTAQIAPTLLCNFQCPRCSYGGSKLEIIAKNSKQLIHMDRESLFFAIDRIVKAGIVGLVFTGGGEPLLNANTIHGMRYARDKGLKVGLFTNGALLDPEVIEDLIDLKPSFIRISLDSGTAEIHSLLHGYDPSKNYFEKIIDALFLLAKKKVHRLAKTTIGIGVSVEPVNLHDLENVAKLLRDIYQMNPEGGIDYIVFRPVVNYDCGGFLEKTKPTKDFLQSYMPKFSTFFQDFTNNGSQYPSEVFSQANEIIDKEISEILETTDIKVINIRTKMVGISNAKRPYSRCRACPWYIFVGPDGTVYNCVELAFESDVAIGNILKHSLDEIWRSPQRKRVIDYINSKGLKQLCPPVCLYYEMNILFEHIERFSNNSCFNDALKWVENQEKGIAEEIETGAISQPHIEFI